jgi:hypothetical protein
MQGCDCALMGQNVTGIAIKAQQSSEVRVKEATAFLRHLPYVTLFFCGLQPFETGKQKKYGNFNC